MKEYSLAYSVYVLIDNTPLEKLYELSVSGLALKYRVKPSYLSRSFPKYYYEPLRDYLEYKRLFAFKQVAFDTKNPQVNKILAILNIPNTSHFIRRFKRVFNKTPGQFCKIVRGIHKNLDQKFFKY